METVRKTDVMQMRDSGYVGVKRLQEPGCKVNPHLWCWDKNQKVELYLRVKDKYWRSRTSKIRVAEVFLDFEFGDFLAEELRRANKLLDKVQILLNRLAVAEDSAVSWRRNFFLWWYRNRLCS